MKKITVFGILMLFLVGLVSAVTLQLIGNKNVDENQLLTFTLSATNNTGQVVYSTDSPVGNLDPSTGVFTWTPGYGEADLTNPTKVYMATFMVNDTGDDANTGNASEPITIRVYNFNRAPTANAGADQTVDNGTLVTLNGQGSSDPDGDILTYTWTRISGPTVSLDTTTPSKPTFTAPEPGTYVFNLIVDDTNLDDSDTVTITVEKPVKLRITDLDIKVGTKTDKNICTDNSCEPDDYTIDEKIKPGDQIKFTLEITNLFTDDEDVEIESVVVTIIIDGIDDGDELEEESDDQDIREDDHEDFTIEFNDIPLLLEDDGDTYDVTILVEGEDEDGNDYEIELKYLLEIEKERHDVRITDAKLRSKTVSCNRRTSLDIDVVNVGRDDEDEVRVTVTNTDLDIDFEEIDIDLEAVADEDAEYSNSITINAEDALPGDYPIGINIYYDYSKTPKKDRSDVVILTVEECATSKPPKEEEEEPEEEEEEEEEIVVIVTGGEETVPPITGQFPVLAIEEETTFAESAGYIVLLIVAALVLIGLIIWIVVLLKK